MGKRSRKVFAHVQGSAYQYKDENGNSGDPLVVNLGDTDTLQWESDDGDIEITFADGSLFCPPVTFPITAPKGQLTPPHGVCAKPPKHKYKYSVNVKAASHPGPDDPHIQFDVVLDGGDTSGSSIPADLVKATEQAWEKLFDKLSTLKSPESASGIPLFKCGINNISVSVEVEGVTISVAVSGPDTCN
jgi:hypothetical protein